VRSVLDFSFARDGRLWKLIYGLLTAGLFGYAIARRFALPLTPILDADSPNFLWPALLKLNGEGFVHTAGLNFLYPAFLFVLLRVFSDFRVIVVVQHLLGLTGGVFFLLGWNRLHDLDVGACLRRSVHQVIGLVGAAIYLLSPTPMLFEMQIRAEALCMFAQLLGLWVLFEFVYHRRERADTHAFFYGLGAIGSAFLLYSLKPSFTLAALFTIGLVLGLVVGGRQSRNRKIMFLLGALAVGVAFLLPERILSRSDPVAKIFLPQTLFSIHANIIRDQMNEDLARGTATPFPEEWLRTAAHEFSGEIGRLHVSAPAQFSLLGFDPDHLMNGENAIFTRWQQHFGSVEEWKRFLDYYFWHAVRHRPLAFVSKIGRQLAVFYNWKCPAFTTYPKIALVAWHYAPSLAIIRDPENWPQLSRLPGGPRLLSETEKISVSEIFFNPGKRPILFHAILAWTYLPLLVIGVGAAILRLSWRKTTAREKWPALLVIFLFLITFGNVLAISVVHSMEVLRYSTVQFAAALFAQLWAARYLVDLVLRQVPSSR
jgi:hypothetical protein